MKRFVFGQAFTLVPQYGSLAFRSLSPGGIQSCYFEQNFLFLVKLNPEFSSLALDEAKATLGLCYLFFVLMRRKGRLSRCHFDRTARS